MKINVSLTIMLLFLLGTNIFPQIKPLIKLQIIKKEVTIADYSTIYVKVTNTSNNFIEYLSFEVNLYDKDGEFLGQENLVISNLQSKKEKVELFILHDIPLSKVKKWEFINNYTYLMIDKKSVKVSTDYFEIKWIQK